MGDTAANLSVEKRYDHLKLFFSNIAGLIFELKDLMKVHEILIYKAKLESSEKGNFKKYQEELTALKQKFEIIKKENDKMESQLKYYKSINDSINSQINHSSDNIKKMKSNIILEEQKKVEMKKYINDLKCKYCKALKQKQILDDNFLHLTKENKESYKENKEINNLFKELETKIESTTFHNENENVKDKYVNKIFFLLILILKKLNIYFFLI
ncbi:conserved Plasmodium protein, unknown function [Plasmodium relictum]|uniref:Uncharacterized protein n=1 Tax=Plasmodium relictum TaxID=85471 RepID=A0A1J1H365_PLARL|nr:conserved Plasmodium protein, unknown function [Plasmodium relictum]CRG99325.1 conserved Plasmodium protein, unknown function [Plasmodium relictum]